MSSAVSAKASIMVKVQADIATDGVCAIMTETDSHVPFTYTVGLEKTWGHPELIIVGVPGAVGKGILNSVITDFVSKSKPLSHGHQLNKEELNGPCDLRVHQPNTASDVLMSSSSTETDFVTPLVRVYYHSYPLPDQRAPRILQILWPSAQGVWPDDAAKTRTVQTVL